MAGEEAFGLLLVDKPVGPTSHDIVNQIRRRTGVGKVGHTGTLDPLASGLLVICLGAATRLSEYLIKKDKRYLADIRFGIETDSHDAAGEVVEAGGAVPTIEAVKEALAQFRGELEQIPPAYSAIKVKGKKAYQLARAGQKPELAARPVVIHQLDIVLYLPPDLTIEVHCSSGTYIRSLARDVGRKLGTGAHLVGLKRTGVGRFSLDQASSMAELTQAIAAGSWRSKVIPAAQALPELTRIELTPAQLEDVRHGRAVEIQNSEVGLARGISERGELVAILERQAAANEWRPRKVFLS